MVLQGGWAVAIEWGSHGRQPDTNPVGPSAVSRNERPHLGRSHGSLRNMHAPCAHDSDFRHGALPS